MDNIIIIILEYIMEKLGSMWLSLKTTVKNLCPDNSDQSANGERPLFE